MQGDTKSIAKIMMKYALAFAALYIFPWLLDLIKGIFKGEYIWDGYKNL